MQYEITTVPEAPALVANMRPRLEIDGPEISPSRGPMHSALRNARNRPKDKLVKYEITLCYAAASATAALTSQNMACQNHTTASSLVVVPLDPH